MAKLFAINKGEIASNTRVTNVDTPAQDIQLIINTDVISKQDVMDAINNLWMYIEQNNEVKQ